MLHSVKRSRKSRKVSWAPGGELFQVKLFLSDDCPSQVASECRYDFPMKTSGTRRSATVTDDFPPGFVRSGTWGRHGTSSVIPQLKWKCPPTFIIDLNWHVASGEESEEVVTQKLRENKVLEAFYPHGFSTPPNPLVTVDVSSEFYDDHQTVTVPLSPVEDEEIVGTSECVPEKDMQTSRTPLPQDLPNLKSALVKLPGEGADVMAAISTALTAFLASNKQGSLVDTNLLVKILSDPKMVEQLVRNHGGAPSPNVSTPPSPVSNIKNHALNPEIALASSPYSSAGRISPENFPKVTQSAQTTAVSLPRPASSSTSGVVDPSAQMSHIWEGKCPVHAQLNQLKSTLIDIPPLQQSTTAKQSTLWATETTPKTDPIVAAVKVEPVAVKNLDYFKNLIRQHGRERNDNLENDFSIKAGHINHGQSWKRSQNFKPRDMNIKTDKPCMYFRSARGCRKGSSCPFSHDMTLEWWTGSVFKAPSAKKMRLEGQIADKIVL